MFKAILLVLAWYAPSFAQDMGADPSTTKILEIGANGGFFVLAMHWLRQDAKQANERLFELSKDCLVRIEHAYRNRNGDSE